MKVCGQLAIFKQRKEFTLIEVLSRNLFIVCRMALWPDFMLGNLIRNWRLCVLIGNWMICFRILGDFLGCLLRLLVLWLLITINAVFSWKCRIRYSKKKKILIKRARMKKISQLYVKLSIVIKEPCSNLKINKITKQILTFGHISNICSRR